MKALKYISILAVLFSLAVLIQADSMAASLQYHGKEDLLPSGQSTNDFQGSFGRKLRLISDRQELEMQILEQILDAKSREHQATQQASSTSSQLLAESASASPDATAIYAWLTGNQQASPLNLISSYPADPGIVNQAFTYDQALSGMVMLKQGDVAGAKKIFDFYNSQWDGTGYWTVYNTQDLSGPKIEYDRIMGPNAWIALFALQYNSTTKDPAGLDLATKIGKWIRTLPHQNGGVAMGESGTFWADKFSTENNLDYYALLKILSVKASSRADQRIFKSELSLVKGWLKTQAYDPVSGLFRRGAGDGIKSVDVNSWAILIIGVSALQKEFGINADNLVANIENTFAVQNDGTFGGNIQTSKGFDFSDSVNAALIGRSGLNWVEGTNHMIDVYKTLAAYYSQRKTANPAKASYYQERASYFANLNAANSVSANNTLSYTYTDQAGVQVFSDNPYWRTAYGPAASSTSWVYLSIYGYNPFLL